LLRANIPLIWIKTHDDDVVLNVLKQIVEKISKKIKIIEWDCVYGFTHLSNDNHESNNIRIPDNVIPNICRYEDAVIFTRDFHASIISQSILRRLIISENIFEHKKINIVFCVPEWKIPIQLLDHIVKVDMPLPSIEDFRNLILQYDIESMGLTISNIKEGRYDRYLEALKGLTMRSASRVLSTTFVDNNFSFDFEYMSQMRFDIINKDNNISIIPPKNIDELGGFKPFKQYVKELQKTAFSGVERGIVLFGLPGCGKSTAIHVMGSILKAPIIKFDMGQMLSKYVGESESKFEQFRKIVSSVGRCIVFADEFDKMISGTNNDNTGVRQSIIGKLLSWLEDERILFAATCNDFNVLERISYGAFIGRLIPFFVDLPSESERKEIIPILIKKLKLDNNNQFKSIIESLKNNNSIFSNIIKKTRYLSGREIEILLLNIYKFGFHDGFKFMKPKFKNLYLNTDNNDNFLIQLKNWAKENAILATEGFVPEEEQIKKQHKLRPIK